MKILIQPDLSQLTVTPATINRYVDDHMTLRCDRNSHGQTELTQIFHMSISKKSETGWNLVAEQRTRESRPRVTGNGTASASIASDIPDVFLQVSWDNIGDDNFGEFVCDVMGVDDGYRIVTANSPVMVISENEILLSQKTHQMVMDLNETFLRQITSLSRGFQDVKTEIPSLQRGFQDLKTEIPSIKRGVADLASTTGRRLSTVEKFMSGLTQWPGGFYALLQPKTGCPVDLAFFGGTHKFHKIHTEGGDRHSSALGPHVSFVSESENFVTLEFCEVTKQFNTEGWPQGSFCVNKQMHKSCPAGFTDGIVWFDTEDTRPVGEARNNVVYSTHNPCLYFCCQDSGSATVPIQLPTSSPFLLYRYGGVCQAVEGMSVSEEYLKVDTEDDRNTDFVSDRHPDVEMGDSTIKMHLCYYKKAVGIIW